jgi:hypothetical protein
MQLAPSRTPCGNGYPRAFHRTHLLRHLGAQGAKHPRARPSVGHFYAARCRRPALQWQAAWGPLLVTSPDVVFSQAPHALAVNTLVPGVDGRHLVTAVLHLLDLVAVAVRATDLDGHGGVLVFDDGGPIGQDWSESQLATGSVEDQLQPADVAPIDDTAPWRRFFRAVANLLTARGASPRHGKRPHFSPSGNLAVAEFAIVVRCVVKREGYCSTYGCTSTGVCHFRQVSSEQRAAASV